MTSGTFSGRPNQLRPIETEYNSDLFRSRLEARWAVFFKTLEIKYEYEKRGGFYLGNGYNYLPDFFIPAIDTWVEIKGQEPNEEEITKAALLHQQSGQDVIILWHDLTPCQPFCVEDILTFWTDSFGIFHTQRGIGFCRIMTASERFSFSWVASAFKKARQARFEHGETPEV